ncbi:hypothetical protein ACXOL9_004734 [Vibrio parahaemolyticus]
MAESVQVKMTDLILTELEKQTAALERISTRRESATRSMFNGVGFKGLKKLAPAALGAGLIGYAKSVIDTEANMRYLSQQTGIAATRLLAFERAGNRFGTSFSGHLLNLQSQISGLGMEDMSHLLEGMAKFGIKDPQKIVQDIQSGNLMSVFTDLQKEWSGLSKFQKAKTSELLGFDTGMRSIMDNFAQFLDYAAKTNVTEKDIQDAAETKKTIDTLIQDFTNAVTAFVNGVNQGIQPFVDKLAEIDAGDFADNVKKIGEYLGEFVSLFSIFFTDKNTTPQPQQTVLDSQKEIEKIKQQISTENNPAKRAELKAALQDESNKLTKNIIVAQAYPLMPSTIDTGIEGIQTAVEKLTDLYTLITTDRSVISSTPGAGTLNQFNVEAPITIHTSGPVSDDDVERTRSKLEIMLNDLKVTAEQENLRGE